MQKINEEQLKEINGGAVSAAYITAIVRGIGIIVDLGRSVGTAIRRIQNGRLC